MEKDSGVSPSKEKPARILVADDDAIITRLMEATLENAGYEVLTAGDGATALLLLEEAKPDLVMLDIRMPNMDGLTVLKRIREKSSLPVIMVTTVTDTQMLADCLSAGANDYIEKPFLSWELLGHVKAKLRRSGWQGDGSSSAHSV